MPLRFFVNSVSNVFMAVKKQMKITILTVEAPKRMTEKLLILLIRYHC